MILLYISEDITIDIPPDTAKFPISVTDITFFDFSYMPDPYIDPLFIVIDNVSDFIEASDYINCS